MPARQSRKRAASLVVITEQARAKTQTGGNEILRIFYGYFKRQSIQKEEAQKPFIRIKLPTPGLTRTCPFISGYNVLEW